MIQGTVVPTGQQVPSAGEVADMHVDYCPFDAEIFMPSVPAGEDDIRRLLWDACREVLSRDMLTVDDLVILQRRVMDLRRLVEDTTPPITLAPNRNLTASEHQRLQHLMQRASDSPESRATMEGLRQEQVRSARQRSEAPGVDIEITDAEEPMPAELAEMVARVSQRLDDNMFSILGLHTSGTATGRFPSAHPPTTNTGRTAINRRDPPDTPDGPTARWPSPDFVLGQPEGTYDRDTDGRAPRNIRLRDKAPEAGGGDGVSDSVSEPDGEVE